MEYIKQRANEIINDKLLIDLLYLIGKEHNIDKCIVDKDKYKIYFLKYVIEYLK